MNIEQAKALKVGDVVVFAGESGSCFTKDGSYKISALDGEVGVIDDKGGEHRSGYGYLVGKFELKQPTNLEWIPFDADRMGEAVGYRHANSGKALAEVTLFSRGHLPLKAVNGDELDDYKRDTEYVQMQVPVTVKYPCLVRSGDGDICLMRYSGHAPYDRYTPLTKQEVLDYLSLN